jgi:small subunit ribosomal protein S20
LPGKKSVQKTARAALRRAERKKPIRSSLKTYVTKARRLIVEGELEAAQQAVKQAIIALDKAAGKGVIHPNNAARRKSRLIKRLNAAQASQAAPSSEPTPEPTPAENPEE